MKLLGGAVLAAAVLMLAGCGGGAGPDVTDAQAGTPEARYVEAAHKAAPPSEKVSDDQLVTGGRQLCKLGPMISDRESVKFVLNEISKSKGPVTYTRPQWRGL